MKSGCSWPCPTPWRKVPETSTSHNLLCGRQCAVAHDCKANKKNRSPYNGFHPTGQKVFPHPTVKTPSASNSPSAGWINDHDKFQTFSIFTWQSFWHIRNGSSDFFPSSSFSFFPPFSSFSSFFSFSSQYSQYSSSSILHPWYLSCFHTDTFWGLKILHSKVRKFAEKSRLATKQRKITHCV